ncbi:MAG TPA: TraR/DksA C4-type zinc finger protein [Chitinophagales bacterium]|nr:TraR/DksA C4-type zinc finger protein [Chitinophagales bacterium]
MAKPITKKTVAPKVVAKPKVAAKPIQVKPIAPPPAPKKAAAVKKTAKHKALIAKVTAQPVISIDRESAVAKAHQISAQRHQQVEKAPAETKVVRYGDADLALFKATILKKIAKAKDEIDFYTAQIRSVSESDTQFASMDDGSVTSERENMNQIVSRMQKLISHLESALVRIENKSYGICRETGRLIPKERLLIVPHATLSVEGKKMEKK